MEHVSLSVGDIAPIAYLRINAAALGKANDDRVFPPPKIPPLLEGEWEEVEASVGGISIDSTLAQTFPPSPAYATQALSPLIINTKPGRRGVWYSISNMFIPQDQSTSIEIECRGCWEKVRGKCFHEAIQLSPKHHQKNWRSFASTS